MRSTYLENKLMIVPFKWNAQQEAVALLDQTQLPVHETWLTLRTPDEMAEAIRMLRVRGAPAIGNAAAYGVVLSITAGDTAPQATARTAIELLAGTRPTAVNLFWALERMRGVVERHAEAAALELKQHLLEEAQAIEVEDQEAGRRIGEHGLKLLHKGMSLLTHCHAGGVATSGYGTALAPMFLSIDYDLDLHVFVDETRPLLQGSRITAWELQKMGIRATLISDNMAGHVMQQGRVDAVIVGADRIAANGDAANKIGTYTLAVLAKAHEIPFYVAAPRSTIDLNTPAGAAISIEERNPREITHRFGTQTAPDAMPVYNPAFDVTPARLITAIITECGVLYPPFGPAIERVFA